MVTLAKVADKENSDKQHRKKWKMANKSGSAGAIYGLGIIGVAIYYIQTAPGFWEGVLGVIKAIFWPAVLLYKVFAMLKL